MMILMSQTVEFIVREKGIEYLQSLGKPTPKETKKGIVYFIIIKDEEVSNSTEDNKTNAN